MFSFFLAPVLSFFSVRLYREALRSGVGRGILYLLYLTVLFCLLTLFLCRMLLLPLAGSFMDWLVSVTPEMTLTQTGLKVSAQEPYLVKHDVLGPLYLVDTTKDLAALERDSSKALILIGKEHIVIQNPYRSEKRVFDLKQAMEQVKQNNRPVTITKRVMQELNRRFQGMLIPFILVLLAPFFFIWKLLAVLFYSLIALLLNLFRKEKLNYKSLFSLACYAITPVTVVQATNLFIPDMHFNLNLLLAIGLTTVYLAYGMFVENRSSS